tara:strand:- start:222 stop:713 length:492 start_codon:yes stop_codon:yes gene_type:complete
MWERIKAFIKSIVEYFVPKKTIKQIEEGFRNKLKKLVTNPKYKQNIQQLILHTIEKNQKRLHSELPPDDEMVGLYHCVIWFERNVPEVFDSSMDVVHKDLNKMFAKGRLIRVPGVALNSAAMGWITSHQKYDKQMYGRGADLKSLLAQDYIRYIVKNARRGIK